MRPTLQLSLAAVTIAAACVALGTNCNATVAPPPPDPPIVIDRRGDHCTIAAIGDYGNAGPAEASVASLVEGFAPDLVVTMGDNNYPNGAASTIDANIGQYYSRYIAPYRGDFGEGATDNRFFPSLGNHDWRSPAAAPYLEYFDLPGNERYYDLRWGPVHLFAVDSDRHEPDGVTADGVQAQWLRRALGRSDAPWKIVYMHHPPYSSGDHGGSPVMRWPFADWGVDAVIAGHDHHYERLERDGVLYFVNGVAGRSHYGLGEIDPASKVRVTGVWGAMKIEAERSTITFTFVDEHGRELDRSSRTR